MNAIIKIILGAAVFGVGLQGCGADKPEQETLLCKDLSGSVYYTDTLEAGYLTLTGEAKMHWSVQFDDRDVSFHETDTVAITAYQCEDGKVTLPGMDTELLFSDEAQRLTLIRPNQKTLTYTKATHTSDYGACASVAGKHYALESLNTAQLVAIEYPITGLDFGQGQAVDYRTARGETLAGLYDCTGEGLHVHRSVEDNHPILVEVLREGQQLQLTVDTFTYVISQVEEPVFCTEIYQPVCSVRPQNIQCLVAPCPVGVYETAPNRCHSDADGLIFQAEGECGELEGQPYYELKACTREYRPVCGVVASIKPCDTVPCPAQIYQEFGNKCEAEAAQATQITNGECGDKAGQPARPPEFGACPAVYIPVCGKFNAGIVCVTTPCPGHQYKTFGNHCEAGFAQVNVAFLGECGDLDGLLTSGEPPVQMVKTLPTTFKEARVIDATITDDVLSVNIGYSGCDQQHFQLFVSTAFAESFPVQAQYRFKPLVEDSCEAYFTTHFSYDLKPLKHAYQEVYQSKTGQVSLPGIGLYSF